MTIAEKREIVNTIINLLLQLTAEEEVQEQPASASKPAKVPAQSVKMLTIKECAALVPGLSEHTVRQLVKRGEVAYMRSGAGKRGKILVYKSSLLKYLGDTG